MGKNGCLYRIIEFRNYRVLVPFICHKCGACCRNFAPQMPADDLLKIARYLNKSQQEIKRQHTERYRKRFTDTPANCIFLNKKNQCMIYPLRPEACRLYPFTSFGAADVNCPGHKEFYRIVDALFARRIYAATWDPEAYRGNIRAVPTREWPILLRKFVKAELSKPMMQEFIKIDKVPEDLYKKST